MDVIPSRFKFKYISRGWPLVPFIVFDRKKKIVSSSKQLTFKATIGTQLSISERNLSSQQEQETTLRIPLMKQLPSYLAV